MRRSRQWNFTLGGAVTVAVGQAIGFVGFVEVEVEVVMGSIRMRGSVRERGRVLGGLVSYCKVSWEEGWLGVGLPQCEQQDLKGQHSDCMPSLANGEDR